VEYDADAALYPAAQFPEADGEAADAREKDVALGSEEKQGSAVPVRSALSPHGRSFRLLFDRSQIFLKTTPAVQDGICKCSA